MTTNQSLFSTDFARSVYQEHLDEAAFLFDQRRFLFHDPDVGWQSVAAFEHRLEAHLSDLVSGGEAALAVCDDSLSSVEPDVLHTLLRLMARLHRFDDMRRLLAVVDCAYPMHIDAVVDALTEEMPQKGWHPWLKKLSPELGRLIPVAAKLVAARRLEAVPRLAKILKTEDRRHRNVLVWAAGRMAGSESDRSLLRPILSQWLNDEDVSVRIESALALLRMGDLHVRDRLREESAQSFWPRILLALSGNAQDAQVLFQLAASAKTSPEALAALGLLGYIPAMDLLMDYIDVPAMSAAAALALEMITGAGLREEPIQEEKIDPDELFDEERKKYNKAAPPQSPESKQVINVSRICRDKLVWRAWWQKHKTHFVAQRRYRNGHPYSPQVLLESLNAGHIPRRVRQWACEELMIRYSFDVHFEPDMFVHRQIKGLAQATRKMAATAPKFEPGQWYFNAKMY